MCVCVCAQHRWGPLLAQHKVATRPITAAKLDAVSSEFHCNITKELVVDPVRPRTAYAPFAFGACGRTPTHLLPCVCVCVCMCVCVCTRAGDAPVLQAERGRGRPEGVYHQDGHGFQVSPVSHHNR